MAARVIQTESLEDGEIEIVGFSEPLEKQDTDLSNTSPIDLGSDKFERAASYNLGLPSNTLKNFKDLDDVELTFNQTAREMNRADQSKI